MLWLSLIFVIAAADATKLIVVRKRKELIQKNQRIEFGKDKSELDPGDPGNGIG